jgi:hypothetical protein
MAAAECVERARATQNEETRVSLLALGRKWIDLAQHRSDSSALRIALEAFSDPKITE